MSQSTWDQARARAEQAKAQYESALAGAKQGQATLAGASAATGLAGKSLSDSIIRAPFDGLVAERRISPGEYATPGKVVAVVVSDNPLRLKIDVSEADVARVAVGARVDLVVVAFPGKSFEGVIKRVGASVRQQSRSLPVEAEVSNASGGLRPGMFARVRMAVPGAPSRALLVPRAAVGTTGASVARVRPDGRPGGRAAGGDRPPSRRLRRGDRRGSQRATRSPRATIDKLSDGAAVTAK